MRGSARGLAILAQADSNRTGSCPGLADCSTSTAAPAPTRSGRKCTAISHANTVCSRGGGRRTSCDIQLILDASLVSHQRTRRRRERRHLGSRDVEADRSVLGDWAWPSLIMLKVDVESFPTIANVCRRSSRPTRPDESMTPTRELTGDAPNMKQAYSAR